jgi:hypothetical protein
MKSQSIVDHVTALLQPLGFQHRKATWNRRVGVAAVQVLNIQTDKSSERVTVNLGLTDLEVTGIVWGKPMSRFVAEPSCIVRSRLGELVDRRDKWWEISAPTASAEISALILEVGLPFLERHASRESMRRWLLDTSVSRRGYPAPILSLAVIENLTGDPERAYTRLADLRKRLTGGWGDRVGEVAARLGYSPLN